MGTSLLVILATTLFAHATCNTLVRLLVAMEEADANIQVLLDEVASAAERNFGENLVAVDIHPVEVDRENEDKSYREVCATLYNDGITLILDMTWTGWDKLRDIADNWGIIYKRGDSTISPYVQAMDDYLMMKNATDAAMIFENEKDLNQTLFYLIGRSIIRLVVISDLSEKSASKIRNMRPSPSYYVIYATTPYMERLFTTAIATGLVNRNGTWNLVFTDYDSQNARHIYSRDLALDVSVSLLTMKSDVCSRLTGESSRSCPNDFQVFPYYFTRLTGLLVSVLSEIKKSGANVSARRGNCGAWDSDSNSSNVTRDAFDKNLLARIDTNYTFDYLPETMTIVYRAEIKLETLYDGKVDEFAKWNRNDRIVTLPGKTIEQTRRYFRVGTAEAVPWSWPKRDPNTGQPVKDAAGNDAWEGYCVDLIRKLSEEMDFDYELVIPEDESFGRKTKEGKWTGLVGDLSSGRIDIVVAALTMTSEREEVIDFIAPYFEQSGILIVMRKPVRKTSLFKFMTVLRPEVWLSIVGALTLTGVMIWILDKYSPYSARNNKRLYPYPCREFTLKESFWFALTSFTPQGGGEAPKALSSRTLVAAYWLFVVLMLATFTANLAAFLTVERMQSPVESLEQLARQSRINYTVVANSTVHQYFLNMKNAEDKLYNVWKEITLNSTSDQVEYRVWDYPIKEQYGHILQAIVQAGPVKTVEEGFEKVIASENAEFAFIHDSSLIKYEVTRNCNLTDVGEIFAEQPYAIAVQQGSHLQEEISRRVLDLQKDRYFEFLSSKYWNQSLKGVCPDSDDNEGITLESLGGVFIATLFGLALAMITLAAEVIYYRRRNALQRKGKTEKRETSRIKGQESKSTKNPLAKLQMKPAPVLPLGRKPLGPQPRVSHISVYPKNFPFKD